MKTNWTTAYRFSPLYAENNYIILEPKVPITSSTGYSICLRVCIWRWENTVVFDSPAVKLVMYAFDSIELCFSMKKDRKELCFTWINISSEWNALCFTHNFSDFLLNVTLNGEWMDSKKIQLNSNFIEGLTKPFSIGLVSLFWGQITDFNVWNRPLANKELNQYSFGCQDKFSMQPEILDWSNTNITNPGVNATHFKIPSLAKMR